MKSIANKFNMLFFRGKLTVNPNTLNNEIHTYFFANYWQRKHKEELFAKQKEMYSLGLDPYEKENQKIVQNSLEHSYENWMKLIKSVAHFNRLYIQCFSKAYQTNIPIMDKNAFRLFHDWDVWGDSTSYPELTPTAYFDSSSDTPLGQIAPLLGSDVHLTTKLGTNKCVMANQDTDSQGMSKMFVLTLNMNDQLKLSLNPYVNREIHTRTVDGMDWTSSKGAHWSANGTIKPLYSSVQYQDVDANLKKLLPDKTLTSGAEMRMFQYRYNHPAKVSSVIGYLMNTEAGQKNQDQFSYINKYWRIVECNATFYKKQKNKDRYSTSVEIFLKNVQYGNSKRGILVDLSAVVFDANSQDLFPLLPTSFQITITPQGRNPITKTLNQSEIKDAFHKYAGLILLESERATEDLLPAGKRISIQISNYCLHSQIQTEDPDVIFDLGLQNDYNLQIRDKFKKTLQLPKEIPSNQSNFAINIDDKTKIVKCFEDSISYDLYLTRFGQPVSGSQQMELVTSFHIDTSGLTQYTTNRDYLTEAHILHPRQRIKKLLDDSPDFKSYFDNYEDINSKVFQGRLDDEIIQQTNKYIDLLYTSVDGKQKKELQYTFTKKEKTQVFQLSFNQASIDSKTNKKLGNKKTVHFQNGYAQILISLNQNLTQANNPRHPALESLCLVGNLKFPDPTKKEDQIKPLNSFTAIFFQNPEKNPYDDIDWLNVVGPKLKLMGLIYPSMQNIVNLYDYDGLSMSAMKRAFEIEDENHSRYMPATREMSPFTHRQIRRWLYNPIYDAEIHLQSSKQHSYKSSQPHFKSFEEGKQKLVELLKQAFKLELTTIPLYLGAMYSIKHEGEVTKLIRNVVKDEMKHLFIVSNLLNALGEVPPYPLPNQRQFKYIPTFPLINDGSQKGIICFHFQLPENKQWKEFMGKVPIQSAIQDQLLRFIIIEMPTEAYQIQIEPVFMSPINPSTPLSLDKDAKYEHIKCQQTRQKLLETAKRINRIIAAVNAVSLEEKHNRSTVSPQKQERFMTIGMAYELIMDYLWALNDLQPNNVFTGQNEKQFTYVHLPHMTEIINLRTALDQIRQITEEGEGSSLYTVTGDIKEASHFIKFIEIFTGCKLTIQSKYEEKDTVEQHYYKRSAKYRFTPDYERFPNFPAYSKVEWSEKTDQAVKQLVDNELKRERMTDPLIKNKFPNTFAPRAFLNSYQKILEELGFIFRADPKKFQGVNGQKNFQSARLKKMEDTIAKMRQMSLSATHIVHPNDTFDHQIYKRRNSCGSNEDPLAANPNSQLYPSSRPNFNIAQSTFLPRPDDAPKDELDIKTQNKSKK